MDLEQDDWKRARGRAVRSSVDQCTENSDWHFGDEVGAKELEVRDEEMSCADVLFQAFETLADNPVFVQSPGSGWLEWLANHAYYTLAWGWDLDSADLVAIVLVLPRPAPAVFFQGRQGVFPVEAVRRAVAEALAFGERMRSKQLGRSNHSHSWLVVEVDLVAHSP